MTGTATTEYVLDTEGGLVGRLGAATTTGGTTTSAWYVRGWGGELARETGGGVAWYLADRLGSVRAEYDAGGTFTTRTDYDPFGTPESGTGLGAPADYGFTGEPQDAGTGTVDLRARRYAPGEGRFLSRDPWAGDPATPQTLGPYAYAHDDPVNGTDRSGLCTDPAPESRFFRYCINHFIPFAKVTAPVRVPTLPAGTTLPAEVDLFKGDGRPLSSAGGTYKQGQWIWRDSSGALRENHVIGDTKMLLPPFNLLPPRTGFENRCDWSQANTFQVWCNSSIGIPVVGPLTPLIYSDLTFTETGDGVRITGQHSTFPALEIWQYGEPSGPRLLYYHSEQGHTPFELVLPAPITNAVNDLAAWCRANVPALDLPLLPPISLTQAAGLGNGPILVPLQPGKEVMSVDITVKYRHRWSEAR